MDEAFRLLWQIVIHDMSDVIHVNAASGYVGGDEYSVDTVFETLQRFITLALRAVAVDARHFVFPPLQKFREPVGPLFGAHEDEERTLLLLQQMNQEIKKYLRVYVNYRQSDWVEWLALAEFTHNDKTSSSTSMSPFYVNTGMHPWKGIENAVESRNESADDFAKKMKKIRDKAAVALETTQKNMKKYYDAHRREALDFKVGDKVWLEAKDITTDRPTKKLDDRRLGPYEILEKVGVSAYKLKLPETDKSHPVYNEALLTPYDEPPAH